MSERKKYRVILSGGGTAGHIYPAVAVAECIQERYGKENVELLFVGAKGKMEMEKISALGYQIIGLPIVGLRRSLSLRNLALPFLLIKSYLKARSIIKDFDPQVVIGFGGYASAPILKSAQAKGIRTMLWEGNSFAGMANKLLGKKAESIFVSYDGMERFFAKDKLVRSGNPLRGNVRHQLADKQAAYDYFGFSPDKPVLLVTGGSLGSRILNEAVFSHISDFANAGVNLIWQVGSFYEKEMSGRMKAVEHSAENIHMCSFINRMDYAYAVADLVIARGGASTISELALLGKAAIIVPSSNVADDHQTKNALSLKQEGAVEIVSDADAVEKLIPLALELLIDNLRRENMRDNIKKFAVPDSADIIVDTMNLDK